MSTSLTLESASSGGFAWWGRSFRRRCELLSGSYGRSSPIVDEVHEVIFVDDIAWAEALWCLSPKRDYVLSWYAAGVGNLGLGALMRRRRRGNLPVGSAAILTYGFK